MNLYQIIADNRAWILLSKHDKNKIREITNTIEEIKKSDLTTIRGIGEDTAKKLILAGINTKDELLKKNEEEINKLDISVISKAIILKLIK